MTFFHETTRNNLMVRRKRVLAAGGLLAGLLACASAMGQTASQITPESFRPPIEGRNGALEIPRGEGLAAPEGAQDLQVALAGVNVEGTLPGFEAKTARILAGLSGRTVTAAEIFAAARALEAAYAEAGYVLVRVALPAQRLEDGGRARLVVVDGYLEAIDTTAVPRAVRVRIDALLAPLVKRSGLRMAEIERRLLLAGDTPGVLLRSVLTPGSAPGSSRLRIEARHDAVAGLLTVDNTLSHALGRWNLGAGVTLNSVAGFGELIYLRAAGYPGGGDIDFLAERPRNRVLAAGVVLPIGLDGLRLNLETTDAKAAPRASGGIGVGSTFHRFSSRLRYPWVRSRDLTLSTEVAFDAQEERVRLIEPINAPFSLDILRILRAGGDGFWRMNSGGVLTARATASFGLDALGARSAADASPLNPLSRLGADADFRKLEVELGYARSLARWLSLDLTARAQTSFGEALPQSEQFGLASRAGLSSFDAGTFQGDAGYLLRAELGSPQAWRLGGGVASLTPYVFGAVGEVRLERPTILERAHTRGGAFGAGVRLAAQEAAGPLGASLTLELGRQARNDDVDPDTRLTLIGSFQF